MNEKVGREGLCPIILVFGAMERLTSTETKIAPIYGARVIDASKKEGEQEQERRRIGFCLKNSGGPKEN